MAGNGASKMSAYSKGIVYVVVSRFAIVLVVVLGWIEWNKLVEKHGDKMLPPVVCEIDENLPPQKRYNKCIEAYAERYCLRPGFVWAMIKEESGFNPDFRSRTGAIGLMGVMPGSCEVSSEYVLYSPYENIACGTKRLKKLMDRYGGNEEHVLWVNLAGLTNGQEMVNGLPVKDEGKIRSVTMRILQTADQYNKN